MRCIAKLPAGSSQRMSRVCGHGFDHGRGDAHLRHVAQDRPRRSLRVGDGIAPGRDGHEPMDAQRRALDAVARRAAGIDQHAGAGAIRSRDAARSVGGADARSPVRATRMISPMISACSRSPPGRRQQDDVARREMGLVEPLAQPARAGRADRSAGSPMRPGRGPAVKVDPWRRAETSCSARNTDSFQ